MTRPGPVGRRTSPGLDGALRHLYPWSIAAVLLTLRASVSWKLNAHWCLLDSGETTLTDSSGYSHPAYVSRTRDGSVWLRFGKDHSNPEWIFEAETLLPAQFSLLEHDEIAALSSLEFTDYCVLTDLKLSLKADLAWHPSYLTVFDPRHKETKTVLFRHNKDCLMSTVLTLGAQKQGLLCDGGRKNACGQRNLPERGRESEPVFLRSVNFDPMGSDRWRCGDDDLQNSYTFKGSYYHAYVKVSSCDPPKDSRLFGHDPVMRPGKDSSRSAVVIPSPRTGLLDDAATVVGWQLFVQIVSVKHSVFLQLWRPLSSSPSSPSSSSPHRAPPGTADSYTLVGQTFVRPTELRYVELSLEPRQYIRARRGDVLGLYFPDANPVGWSSVPCAFRQQAHLTAVDPLQTSVSRTLRFDRAPPGDDACRQYSFSAILANRTGSRQIEDWICPLGRISLSSETMLLSEPDQRPLERDLRNENDARPTRPLQGKPEMIQYFASDSDSAAFTYILIGITTCLLLVLVLLAITFHYVAYK